MFTAGAVVISYTGAVQPLWGIVLLVLLSSKHLQTETGNRFYMTLCYSVIMDVTQRKSVCIPNRFEQKIT